MCAEKTKMKVRVPASTSNLGSGFDVVGLALQMYLEVELEAEGEELVIESEGLGASQLPCDENNLIFRMIREHAGDAVPAGLRIRIRNDIPLTRGFGSSAAAIVAGIALGEWLKCGTPPERQGVLEAATAAEGHPDNASAAVLGGLTVSAVIDGQVEATSLRLPYGIEIVVLIPDREIETKKAREVLPLSIPRSEAVFNLQRLGLLLAGLFQNNRSYLYHGVKDRIHQGRRIHLLPAMGSVVKALNDHRGCLGAFISGAGPAVAAFTSGDGQKLGELGVEEFSREGIPAEAQVLAPDYLGLNYD